MGVPKNYAGQKYGLLTAVSITEERRGHSRVWLCQCDCGGECRRVVSELHRAVKRGQTPSCGCLYSKHHSEAATKHGYSRHPLYHIWQGMKQRCYDTKLHEYHRYGGRGIKVYAEWLNPETFIKDMLPTWKPGLTLDRIDVNGDYSLCNCRWATPKQQNRNKRNNRLIGGITVTEFAEKHGISRETVYARIRNGVPLEQLSVPPGQLSKRSNSYATKPKT